jgi:hypothetical protein
LRKEWEENGKEEMGNNWMKGNEKQIKSVVRKDGGGGTQKEEVGSESN